MIMAMILILCMCVMNLFPLVTMLQQHELKRAQKGLLPRNEMSALSRQLEQELSDLSIEKVRKRSFMFSMLILLLSLL